MGTEIKRIGIVFSGGLSRGAIQSAFAQHVLDKIGLERVCCISGSSVGAFNAYAAGCGHLSDMVAFYSKLDCDTTSTFTKRVKSGLFDKGFNMIEDELKVPVYTSGTRIFGLECYYFCLNTMPRLDLKRAINVSMSYPFINGPKMFKHHLWLDGGATDNVPVYPVTEYKPDMIIIFHNYPKYYPTEDLYEIIPPETVVVDVDVTLNLPKEFTSFSLSKIAFQEMIDIGNRDGQAFADFIFSDFDREKVRQRCYEFTRKNIPARHEKSGDALMNFVDVINALYRLKSNLS